MKTLLILDFWDQGQVNTVSKQRDVLHSSQRDNSREFTDPGNAYFPGFFQ